MELNILPTKKSLKVLASGNEILFEGCSIQHDPKVFFKPIEEAIANYLEESADKLVFVFKLDYIDSPSTKAIFNILRDSIRKKGKTDLAVKWFYSDVDPEILELGEILQSKLSIKFEFLNL